MHQVASNILINTNQSLLAIAAAAAIGLYLFMNKIVCLHFQLD